VALAAVEQNDPEIVFQLLELCAQCRLAYVARLGRLGEMAIVCDGHQIAEFL
jgi:hypothetical protein